jgi:mRNA-degrading endonuclease RelE of RelBE toxin-antitoxin system
MSYRVKFIPKFEKELKRLSKKFPSLKSDFSLLLKSLKENPSQGISLGMNATRYVWRSPAKEKVNQAGQG